MTNPITESVWAARGPSIFAPPAKCTASQASEIAQSKRLLKKPGRPVQFEHSLPKATKPAMNFGGAQPGAGRPALDLDIAAMQEMRSQGNTWEQIAEQFGCSTFTARTRCKA